MNKKDIKYRQGRSKAQVVANEKVAFASLFFMVIVLGVTLITAILTSCTREELVLEETFSPVEEQLASTAPSSETIWPGSYLLPKTDTSEKGYDTVHVIYDFNEDGYDDILFAPYRGDHVVNHTPLELYLNKGDNKSFVLDTSLIANNIGPVTARKASTGDFNGDGKLDVVFADHSIHGDNNYFPGGTPSTLLSTKEGYEFSFLDGVTPSFYHASAAGDFDLDGKDEIFIGSYYNPTHEPIEYFVEYEDGEFKVRPTTVNVKCATLSSEFYDVNNDGYLDFVHAGIHEAWVYYGNGVDFLDEPEQLAGKTAYWDIYDIDFYDMDKDGYVEIFLLRNGESQYVQVMSRDETGKYVDKSDKFIDQIPSHEHFVVWLSIGDIIGDGAVNLYESEYHGTDTAIWKYVNGYFKFIGK